MESFRNANISDIQFHGYIRFYSSSSLKYLAVSSVIVDSVVSFDVLFVGMSNLLYFDLQDNGLTDFTGTIIGFDSLQTLLLSGNDMSNLAEYFFDGLCSLIELVLFSCKLNTNFMSNKSDRLFYNLHLIRRLDLSSNSLFSLQSGTFTTNRLLEQLDLSMNMFKHIPFKLKDTPNLKWLDLRNNALSSLEPNEREELDKLANENGGFDLFISGNVLSCGCNNLKFLYWLSTTHVRIDVGNNITCINNEGHLSYLNVSDNYLENMGRICSGENSLSITVALFFTMLLGFLSFFVIWKNQTFIKSKLLQLLTGRKEKTPTDYKIGVFIGSSVSDYNFPCFVLRKFIEDKLQLSTYVTHRDMDPCLYVANSLVNAINDSWRIILVFNEHFLFYDEWSMFTVNVAINTVSLDNPRRVVVLVHESLQHKLPSEVISFVPEENIIALSSWAINYSFCEKLRTCLLQL
jgi:hypothetical protein